jgi:hypothetical protein
MAIGIVRNLNLCLIIFYGNIEPEPMYEFADFPNYQYEKEEIISEKEE